MRKFGFLLALFCLLPGCSLFQTETRKAGDAPAVVQDVPYKARETEDLRKKILVLPFIDSELQRSQKVAELARRAVLEDLLDTRQFVVVNNSDLPQDLAGFLKENKEYDMVGVSRLAATLGVSAVIEGRILEIKARRIGDEIGVFRKLRAEVEVSVQIRAVAARSSREILNTTRKASVETETTRVGESVYSDRQLQEDPALVRAGVKKAFREAVGSVVRAVEKLGWEGRIALVSGEKIYINAGRLSGIELGELLRVSEEGNEVFDPDTGAFIGEAPGRMKGTVEVVSYFGKDGAIATIHSGSGFKENDRVQLY